MAQLEPMDVESDFEDKENSLQINNVLSRASCTEKGYEELDVSEMSMKLRYSITPCASPMSKSYTGNCRDNKFSDIDESRNNGNNNLSQSLNSTLTNIDNKLSKTSPLQPLMTDTLGDVNRNPLGRLSLDSNTIDPNITIILNDNDHLDNLSLPSTTSSATNTPEATTPTKEIPKDGGSPIMRGLKSVFSMFRSSQSPIPVPEAVIQTNMVTDSPSRDEEPKPLATLVSTPISVRKYKESSPKRNSPLKDSKVFTDDLEKELLWKNETTIIFKEEKIPISKLFLQQSQSNHSEVKQNEYAMVKAPDISVEYMDISQNESVINDKTMAEIEPGLILNVTETIGNIESDSEFVDCETTFTKCDSDILHNIDNLNEQKLEHLSIVEQIKDGKDLEFQSDQIQSVILNSPLSLVNIINNIQTKDLITELHDSLRTEEKIDKNVDVGEKVEGVTDEEKVFLNTELSEINILKDEIHKDSISVKNDKLKNVIMENNDSVAVTDNQLNLAETEDSDSQKLSMVCVDDSLHLSNNCNKKEHEYNNILPNKEILDASCNTSSLETLPDEINKTTNLLVSDNKIITGEYISKDTMDEPLKCLQSEIENVMKENGHEQLINKTHTNAVTCVSFQKDFSDDENTLQNDATFSIETTSTTTSLDEMIRDVSLCYNSNRTEINKSLEKQLEGPIDICNEELNMNNDTINVNNFDRINTQISFNPNRELVSIPTDVPLPSDSELEQDKFVEKQMTEKQNYGNLKVNSCAELKSASSTIYPDININLPLTIHKDSLSTADYDNCSKNNYQVNNIPQKTQNIDISQSNKSPNNTNLDTTLIKENENGICSERETATVSSGYVDSCKPIINSVVQDNSKHQIMSDNFIPDIDFKDFDEIITSPSHSPYVSVTEISLPEHEKDNLEIINNQFQTDKHTSPPISPKPIKKTYDINFDNIEDPFATKTRIRLSPTPETPIKKSLPLNNMSKKKNVDKKCDSLKSKQKLHDRKILKTTKNSNSNLDCVPKHDNNEKLEYNECFDMDLTEEKIIDKKTESGYGKNNTTLLLNDNKIWTSNAEYLDSTFENISNDKKCKELTNNKSSDVHSSVEGNSNNWTSQHNVNSVNNISDITKASDFANNDTFSVELRERDINNIKIAYQDDKITTVDLLKDINSYVANVDNSNISLVNNEIERQENETNFNGDLQKATLENITTEDSKSNASELVTDDKTFTSSVCDHINADSILKKDLIREEEKIVLVTDLNNSDLGVDNHNVSNELEHHMTVLDKPNTEHGINSIISEVQCKSVLTESGTICSSEDCLKTESENNFETSLTIENMKTVSNSLVCTEELQTKADNILQHSESKKGKEIELLEVEHAIANSDVEMLSEKNNEDPIESIVSEKQSKQNHTQEVLKTSSNISITTCSSKNTDDDNTVREVLTEDEDTVEGPFFEGDEYSDQINIPDLDTDKNNVMQFDFPPPITNIENTDNDELFIDAEAFEFLLNQNKSNDIAESGKESLFLKFDPLFAKRLSSDGILAALSKIQKRQSTPKKSPKPLHVANNQIESSQPGPSKTNASNQFLDHIEVPSMVKPMMVVNPAVSPVASPRKATPKLNRHSLTFTSPAIAVIDRLLSLNGNNSLMDQNTSISPGGREYNETDIAITQLRELLAEKEINVHNLRCESKELKERLANLESQMKSLESESEERLRKMNILNERLAEKTKINKSMALVVEEYERTIASLISDIEQDKKRNAEERKKLVRERDEQTAHLASMEVSFSDLHSKYEKSKQIILSMKANEDKYKISLKDFEDSLTKMQSNYEFLKQHATSKLNHANAELEKINKAHESEILKLNALLKRKELHITSLEETLLQKTKANEELTAICDELINKVG